jgi:hypothetical protein
LILDDFLIETAIPMLSSKWPRQTLIAAAASHLAGWGERTFHAPEEVPDAK